MMNFVTLFIGSTNLLAHDPLVLGFIFLTFIFAGFIKGSLAIGLPTVSVVLLALFLNEREAIALMLFPLFVSNFLQALNGRFYWRTIWRYRYFILPQIILIIIFAYGSKDVDAEVLRHAIALVTIVFAIAGLIKMVPAIPNKFDKFMQLFSGSIAGVLGGLISVWAPPIVIYLQAAKVDKDEFARASGMMITLGAIPLLAVHYDIGHLNASNTIGSILALIPTLIGMQIGIIARQHISEDFFKTALFSIFLLLGLNMLLT